MSATLANDVAVSVRGLSKRFRVYDTPLDHLKEWITPRGMSFHWAYWALRDITFDIKRGSSVGIVGANGAGKSTLLKILCGTLSPTYGDVQIAGRITGMLELGAGFHPEFSGRQNVYLNARLLGLSDREIEERMPNILAFAELGDFIDHPLRIYSTGMALRLGFSVAANVDPDILIIDEALAVGDAYFQQKCLRHLRQFRDKGGTLLFVSHDPGAVKLLCSEAYLLHEGALVERGTPDMVLDYYNALIARRTSDDAAFRIERRRASAQQPAAQRSGTFAAVITRVDVKTGGAATRTLLPGAPAVIEVEAVALDAIADPTVGIAIRDRLGYEIFGTNTRRLRVAVPSLKPGSRATVSFEFPCNIGPGDYTVTAAIHSGIDHLDACYDWADKYIAFKVLPEADQYHAGVARLPVKAEATVVEAAPTDPHDMLRALFGDAPQAIRFDDESASWTFSGWHATETHEGTSVRWTQRDATFVLAVGEKGTLSVELSADDVQCASPFELTLYANGTEAARAIVDSPKWRTVSFTLPASLRGRMARFSLQCSRTFVPAETRNSSDRRTLGVMVARMWAE